MVFSQISISGEAMPGKKSKTTQKMVVKTKKGKKQTSRKTLSAKKAGKRIVTGKGSLPSGKNATKKSVTGKLATMKKPSKKTIRVKPVKTTKAPVSREKKKLSPREKAIQEIKSKLVAQRNLLLNEAEEALNLLPGQTIFPDLGDQASAEIDRSFMLRLRGREQRLLKKIEEAIDKIESGSFGVCEVCGEDIDVKRLEARPVTTMCISCKTEQEEEERLRGA
jgi:DnaK suppressor protein